MGLFSDCEEMAMTVHNTDVAKIREAITSALVRGGFTSITRGENSIKAKYQTFTIYGNIDVQVEIGEDTSLIKYVISARKDNIYAKFTPPIPVINDRFISNFQIEEERKIINRSFNFCPFCGNALVEGAKFCSKCGSKIQ